MLGVAGSPGIVSPLRPVEWVALIGVFAALFVFHTSPLGLGDIYWHLSTGRWIVEHGALPSTDPFLYTLTDAPDTRQMLLLRGYWLAQVAFYAVHSLGGDYALAALKGVVFVSIYAVLFCIVRNAGAQPLFALLIIAPLPLLFYRYDELRPQLFSFLGTLLVYLCMVQARGQLRAGVRWPTPLIALPIIMMLWANLHRGYILGAVVMLVALIAEAYRYALQCRFMERRAFARYGVGVFVAILASLINPCLGSAYIVDLQEIGQGTYASVDEFLSLWSYAKLYGQPLLFYVPVAIMIISAAALVRRWYKAHPAQVINLIGFSLASVAGFRYMMVGVVMALAVGIPHLSALAERHILKYRMPLLVAALAVAAAIGTLGAQRSAFVVGPVESAYVPEGAAQFIRTQKPPAPLFSPYEYGGYLEWSLGESYKLFYDQRSLDPDIYAEYVKARDGRYQDVFAKHNVRTVVFYFFAPVIGRTATITLALLADANWDVVSADSKTAVFVRHDVNSMPVVDKRRVWAYLREVTEQRIATSPNDADAHVELGRVLLFQGEVVAARDQFDEALRLLPYHADAQRHLGAIRQ